MDTEYYKEKLRNAVGKYADYNRYTGELDYLGEQYDETLEIYDWEIWIGKSQGTIREKAAEMLRVTLELFEDMYRNSEQELYYVMEEIIRLPEIEQLEIWDTVIEECDFSKAAFDHMVDNWELDEYAQEDALQEFKKYLKEFPFKETGM